jgi:hypothetical protein
MDVGQLMCRVGLHSLRTVLDNGYTAYRECIREGCDHRRAVQYGYGGHQPIDRGWLRTGKFIDWSRVQLPQGSAVQPPSYDIGIRVQRFAKDDGEYVRVINHTPRTVLVEMGEPSYRAYRVAAEGVRIIGPMAEQVVIKIGHPAEADSDDEE